MSLLLPLIQELLPMILPSSVHIARASEYLPPKVTAITSTAGGSNGDAGSSPPDPSAETGEPRDEARQSPAKALAPPAHAPAPTLRRDAIVGKSDRLCASVIVVAPGCATRVRHHGENDAILYAASGRRGVLLTNPGGGDPHELEDEQNHGKDGDRNSGEASRTDVTAATQLDAPNARNMSKKATRLKRDAIAPGDVVFIPPWTEHQIANEGSRSLSGDDGGDGDVVWLVVQNGSAPIFVELVDWGGAEAS